MIVGSLPVYSIGFWSTAQIMLCRWCKISLCKTFHLSWQFHSNYLQLNLIDAMVIMFENVWYQEVSCHQQKCHRKPRKNRIHRINLCKVYRRCQLNWKPQTHTVQTMQLEAMKLQEILTEQQTVSLTRSLPIAIRLILNPIVAFGAIVFHLFTIYGAIQSSNFIISFWGQGRTNGKCNQIIVRCILLLALFVLIGNSANVADAIYNAATILELINHRGHEPKFVLSPSFLPRFATLFSRRNVT